MAFEGEQCIRVTDGQGREFQRVGAAVAKALSPKMWNLVVVMGVRSLALAGRRW